MAERTELDKLNDRVTSIRKNIRRRQNAESSLAQFTSLPDSILNFETPGVSYYIGHRPIKNREDYEATMECVKLHTFTTISVIEDREKIWDVYGFDSGMSFRDRLVSTRLYSGHSLVWQMYRNFKNPGNPVLDETGQYEVFPVTERECHKTIKAAIDHYLKWYASQTVEELEQEWKVTQGKIQKLEELTNQTKGN